MNERIKEIGKRLGIVDPEGKFYSPNYEALAELIVQECASLTLDYKNEDYYRGWIDYRDEIKKHFGVE